MILGMSKRADIVEFVGTVVFASKDFAVVRTLDGAEYTTSEGTAFGTKTPWNGSRKASAGGGSIRGGFRSCGDVFHVRARVTGRGEYAGREQTRIAGVSVLRQAPKIEDFDGATYAEIVRDADRKVTRYSSPDARFDSVAKRDAAIRNAAETVDAWVVTQFCAMLAQWGQ